MPAERETYASHAIEYEALISREDHQGNILRAILEITPLDGLDVLDLGAGTGRLARLVAPYARTILAFDASAHMLSVAAEKLRRLGSRRWLAAAADHRRLPLESRSIDLMLSGLSVSYLAVWNPAAWNAALDEWLHEARRVLRPSGRIILLESVGTGHTTPQPLEHLEKFYGWLDESGFEQRWIRTDYEFETPESAARLAGFFFGDELQKRIIGERLSLLPECTGLWWLRP